jgi:hypothetical protein
MLTLAEDQSPADYNCWAGHLDNTVPRPNRAAAGARLLCRTRYACCHAAVAADLTTGGNITLQQTVSFQAHSTSGQDLSSELQVSVPYVGRHSTVLRLKPCIIPNVNYQVVCCLWWVCA